MKVESNDPISHDDFVDELSDPDTGERHCLLIPVPGPTGPRELRKTIGRDAQGELVVVDDYPGVKTYDVAYTPRISSIRDVAHVYGSNLVDGSCRIRGDVDPRRLDLSDPDGLLVDDELSDSWNLSDCALFYDTQSRVEDDRFDGTTGVRRVADRRQDEQFILPPLQGGRRTIWFDLDFKPKSYETDRLPDELRRPLESGEVDPSEDTAFVERLVEHTVSTHLPSCFHGVSCFYEFSSSAGLDWRSAPLHVYFYLDRLVWYESLRSNGTSGGLPTPVGWLKRLSENHDEYRPIDVRPFLPNQPQFVGAPDFKGDVVDPMGSNRSGLLEYDDDVVEVPNVPGVGSRYEYAQSRNLRVDIRRESRSERSDDPGEGELDVEIDPDDFDDDDLEALRERYTGARRRCLQEGEKAREGGDSRRHDTLVHLAVEGAKLVKGDALEREDVETTVRETAERIWREGEPDDPEREARNALSWAFNDARLTLRRRSSNLDDQFDINLHDRAPYDSVQEARDELEADIRSVGDLERGSRVTFAADPGAGKTYSALRLTADELDRGRRVLYTTGTHETREDNVSDLCDILRKRNIRTQNVKSRVARRPDSCFEIGGYSDALEVSPGVGSKFCGGCDHHRDNADVDGTGDIMRKIEAGELPPPDDDTPIHADDRYPTPKCEVMRAQEMYSEATRIRPACIFSTHHHELVKSTPPPALEADNVVVSWKSLAREIVDSPVYPRLQQTSDTWRLEIVRDADDPRSRVPPDDVVQASNDVASTDWNQSGDWSRDARARVIQWVSRFLPYIGKGSGDLELDLEVLKNRIVADDNAQFHRRQFDLLVVDESPIHSLIDVKHVSLEGLELYHDNGLVDYSESTADLFYRLRREIGEYQTLRGSPLRELVEGHDLRLTTDDDPGVEFLSGMSREQRLEALRHRKIPPTSGVVRLVEAFESGDWSQIGVARDDRGDVAFAVPVHREFHLEKFERAIYLDATGDPLSSQIVLPGSERHSYPISLESTTALKQTNDWNASRTGTLSSDHPRDRARLQGTFDLWHSGDDTLHLAFLPWIKGEADYPPVDGLRVGAPDDDERVDDPASERITATYYEATDARGSNKYADCNRVVATAFRVPSGAIELTSQRYLEALRRREVDPDELETSARGAARWQLEGAPVFQALHRIRPTLSENVEIVLLDSRPLSPLESAERTTFDAELVALLTGRANFYGRTSARLALSLVVLGSPGGVYVPSLETSYPRDDEQRKVSASLAFERLKSLRSNVSEEDALRDVAEMAIHFASSVDRDRLVSVVGNAYDNLYDSWSDYVDDVNGVDELPDLEVGSFGTGDPNERIAIAPTLSLERLASALRGKGYDVSPTRLSYNGRREAFDDELVEALEAEPTSTLEDYVESTLSEALDVTSEALCLSRSGARYRLRSSSPDELSALEYFQETSRRALEKQPGGPADIERLHDVPAEIRPSWNALNDLINYAPGRVPHPVIDDPDRPTGGTSSSSDESADSSSDDDEKVDDSDDLTLRDALRDV
jgi:hypothetical protein